MDGQKDLEVEKEYRAVPGEEKEERKKAISNLAMKTEKEGRTDVVR